MTVSTTRRRRASRTSVPPGLCSRCMHRIRWIALAGNRWRFDPTPVDPRAFASPPAYPIWRGRAWPVTALTDYLTTHFAMTESEAHQIVENATWLLLHVCPRGGDDR